MKIFISIVTTLLLAFSVFAQTQAEVIVPTTFLRKSPNSTSEKLQLVQKGERIIFQKTQDTNGWYYVSVLDGRIKGWINGNTIRSIAREAAAEAETESKTVRDDQTKPQAITQIPQSTVRTTQAIGERQTAAGAAADQTTQTVAQTTSPAAAAVATPAPAKAVAVVVQQQESPKEDEEVLRVDTEEVSLNVRVVEGSSNRPVKDLNESHFKVYEDNVLQPITSLTTAEVPTNYALVVDNSRSLRSQLEKIAEAGKIIIGTNRQADQSTVVRFVSTDKIEVIQDFTTDKRRLDEALDGLFIEGGQTAIIDAVYLTARRVDNYEKSRKKDDIKRRALILVSDGDDRGSVHSEQQLFELLRGADVQIYAIGFVRDLRNETDSNGINRLEKAKAFLTRLAQETGGKAYFPASVDELTQIAGDISSELRTQYLITYAPTNEKGDTTFRNIKVVVAEGANKEKRTAITRSGRTSESKGKAAQPNRQNQEQRP